MSKWRCRICGREYEGHPIKNHPDDITDKNALEAYPPILIEEKRREKRRKK